MGSPRRHTLWLCPALLACVQPRTVELPPPPPGANSVFIAIDSPGGGELQAFPADLAASLLEGAAGSRVFVAYYRESLSTFRLTPGRQANLARRVPVALPQPMARFTRSATASAFTPGGGSALLDEFRVDAACHRLTATAQAALPAMEPMVGVTALYPDGDGVLSIGEIESSTSTPLHYARRTGEVRTVLRGKGAIRGLARTDGGVFLTTLSDTWIVRGDAVTAHVGTPWQDKRDLMRLPASMFERDGATYSVDSCKGRIFRYQDASWALTATVPEIGEAACDGCDYNDKHRNGGALIQDGDSFLIIYRSGTMLRTRDFQRFETEATVTPLPICNSALTRFEDGTLLATFDPTLANLMGLVRAPGETEWRPAGDLGPARFNEIIARPGSRAWILYRGRALREVYFGADHTVELLCPIDPDNPVGVYTMVSDSAGQGLILVRSHAGGNVVEWVEEVIPP